MDVPLKGILAVVGGFVIHFTLGTVYTFGNMNPYITSYMRFNSSSPDITYAQSTWIFSLSLFGQGGAMAFGGLLEKKIGARFTALGGCWFMSLGVLLTSVTVKTHFVLVSLTYGVMFGIGTGIAYGVAIAAAMSWFPTKKGLVGGIVAAGFGGGSLVFNQLQTFYINPENARANSTIDSDSYFDQPDILSRVPTCMLILGFSYAALQLLAVLLLFPAAPPQSDAMPLISPKPAAAAESDSQMHPQVAPRGLVRSPQFWILWLTFLVNTQAVVYVSTQYKVYGLDRHFDDHFLALVGSVSSIFNSATRIVWGLGQDFFGYWPPMMAMCAASAVLMGTFYMSSTPGLYFLYVCLLFGVNCGNFALFPATCAKLFGQKFFSINYGLLFTGNALSAIVGAILTTEIKEGSGWLALFLTGTGFSIAGGLLTVLFVIASRFWPVSLYSSLDDEE